MRLAKSPVMLNWMYLPALLLFGVFIYYPFFRGLLISFTDWDGYSQTLHYIGIDNYKRMLTDSRVHTVIINTLIYGLGSTLFQNMFGLLYALLLNKHGKGKTFVRVIVYIPAIVSPIIMGYIWYFLLQYNGGAINDIMMAFTGKPVNLLADPKVNVWIIMVVNTYQFLGIAMMIFLSGLQGISKDYYEAAEIDGASPLKRFANITFPLLAPALTTSIILNLIGGLKLFDVIAALTNGGPGYASASLSTMMYQLYFARQDAGLAASLGNLMFLLITVISLTSLYFLRRKELSQ
ncbi:sugar ABC transporter permease [Paenibacillus dokdonensis]|uniref:Sugar ABC transporter permease n=2 Tax=Paenibacillus dokdonensis TaxID=2567944 RepID=A0ABU6GPT8_9BACL|nr:sugar ABC transporter permease [Paenibacillus dokdonensis]MEC0241152.1 sugar ABC transporter permease [Paenibacillus dokdonensis]